MANFINMKVAYKNVSTEYIAAVFLLTKGVNGAKAQHKME